MVIHALLAFLSFQPFNTSFPYPGQQDGKGSIETSFGCITAGVTQLDASGNMQVLYAAFNQAGDFLWADSIHWDQSSEIFALQDFDGGILFTGSSTNPSTTEDALVWAVTPDCQELWTYTLDLPLQERFTSAAQGTDGKIVCAGSTVSIGAGGNDVLMVALDQNGERLWTKTYGTPGEEAVYHISPCADGGFVLSCQAMDWGGGNGDYWIIRTDASGDTLWTGTYGGPEFEYPWRVIQDGDFFYVAGSTLSFGEGSYDWWILKLDSSGTLIWDRTWGYKGTDTCMALELSGDGIVAGGISEPVQGQMLATVVSFDQNGDVTDEWFYQPGIVRSIRNTGNGFLVGGSTFAAGEDLWAMWTDSTGYAPELGLEHSVPTGGMTLGSNPVSGSLEVFAPASVSSITVRDTAGRTVLRGGISGHGQFDVSGLPPGIYTISAREGMSARFAVVR